MSKRYKSTYDGKWYSGQGKGAETKERGEAREADWGLDFIMCAL